MLNGRILASAEAARKEVARQQTVEYRIPENSTCCEANAIFDEACLSKARSLEEAKKARKNKRESEAKLLLAQDQKETCG